jgi:hypothetical protein
MRAYRFVSLFALTLAFGSSPAWAFLDPPYITPANPEIGDAVSVNVYGGECDVLNIGIVPPAIEQHDADIMILFTGIHEGDPEFCYYGIGTSTFPLGTFPPGAHTLDVERRYMSFSGPWVQETLGIIPFIVSGAPPTHPVAAPTLTTAGLASLLLVLIGAVLRVLRARVRPAD